ncbi:MAG: hypothetical protein WD042_17700 [Phycisphaeraceae bacterium]
MDERTSNTFEFAKESTTQLIALATGVMALTITFASDLVPEGKNNYIWLMKASWVFYFISILGGVWMLHAMTGTLCNGPDDLRHGHLFSCNIRLPSFVQIIAFILGTGFALAFALFSF